MSSNIKTNQLEFDVNKELIFSQFDVCCIRTSEKYISNGALLLDDPQLTQAVHSVVFESGNTMFVLITNDNNSFQKLRMVLNNVDGGNKLAPRKLQKDEVPDNILLQLLINTLGNAKHNKLRFTNLTGHLYCFHPAWFVVGTKSQKLEGEILKVPCLDVHITKDLFLQLNVRTFTSELLRDYILFKKKPFESFPKYVLSSVHNTLRRALNGKDDGERKYIMRQTGKKTELSFLSVENLDKFNQSKMGILATIIERFNDEFSGLAHLAFHEIPIDNAQEHPCSVDTEKSKDIEALTALFNQKPIAIIDCVRDAKSSTLCEKIPEILSKTYGVTATQLNDVSPDYLNIRIIHNQEYYHGQDDPYHQFPGISVQHITIEDYPQKEKSAEAVISAVAHDLIIKDDIKHGHITLYNWSSLNFDGELSFGVVAYTGEDKQYLFMTIHPDGGFIIRQEKIKAFTENEYSRCIDAFEIGEDIGQKIECVIQDNDENINFIHKTDWMTIPEIEALKQELSCGNTYLRNETARHDFLNACTDIRVFWQNGKMHYFSGVVGKGMKPKVERAANIRAVESYEDSTVFFDKLLPLMDVLFVRNQQLTVLPFPVKYLHEYARMHELSLTKPRNDNN